MSALRNLILDVAPQVEEKINFTVPFFYFRGPFCYLSPKFDGVYIGLVKGYQLSNEQGILETKNRKFIRSIHFYSLAEVQEKEEVVRQVLNEAAILNEYSAQQKKKIKKIKK